jgi:hypothetical protein
MSSLFMELDSMFARLDTSIKSKSEQVHQAYESNCIAIEKQFENQQIAAHLSTTADKMVMTLKQNLATKMDEINQRMSVYRSYLSPGLWVQCGKLSVRGVKKVTLFSILDSFIGFQKSTMNKANNCNQFFLCFFERKSSLTSQLAYLNNLRFFELNFEKKILRLRGFFYYEVVEIYSLNNNLFLVLLVDISNHNEMFLIVVDSKSDVLAVQMLEFDAMFCPYKVASPTHVDRIVINYWRKGMNHICVLDYNLNFLFSKKNLSAFQSMVVNNNLIVLKNFDEFTFYDFFLCDRGNYTIDSRYARDQICQFNEDFVYLKRRLADTCDRELTTIKFSIYDYKKDYCYKDFYFDFHESSIPRLFAFQFDAQSNFYVYNYANELKVFDKHGTCLKVVQSRDVSNSETLDKLYEMRCQVIDWNMPLESKNFKMIYLTNSNNLFD